MPKRDPVSIADILAGLKKTTPLGKHLEKAQIWERWPDLVGPHLSEHCHPHTLREGKLTVWADSSVWMSKFSYFKWDLIKRINRMARKELVSDIFLALTEEESLNKEDEST